MYVQDVANLHSISVDLPRACRHKQTSQTLQDVIVLESTGVKADVSPSLSEHFKTIFYPSVFDAMLSKLERRFTDKNPTHMRAVHVPHSHPLFWNQTNLPLLLILMVSIGPL